MPWGGVVVYGLQARERALVGLFKGKVLLLGRDVGQFDSLVDVDTNESV